MKKILILSFVSCLHITLSFGQAKKYVLIEHFSNTYCSICNSVNPGFYQTIAVETNTKIHHISIHSSVPYPQCPLYKADTAAQDARKRFYGLTSTPRVSLNGAALVAAGNITTTNITDAAANTSPIEIKVTETIGTNRTASIGVKTVGNVPTGVYNIYVAVVEKKMNFVGQNGEPVHYNVFRSFLSPSGTPMTVATLGKTTNFSIPYTVASTWAADQIYVLAWVQNAATKEVLNSGTRFDLGTATQETSVDQYVTLAPNPTTGKTRITFENLTPQYLTIQNELGQILESRQLNGNNPIDLDLSRYASGVHYIKIFSPEGTVVKKVLKN